MWLLDKDMLPVQTGLHVEVERPNIHWLHDAMSVPLPLDRLTTSTTDMLEIRVGVAGAGADLLVRSARAESVPVENAVDEHA
jgi:hypothetical protein